MIRFDIILVILLFLRILDLKLPRIYSIINFVAHKISLKRRVNFILEKKIKYYTKECTKWTTLLVFGILIIIFAILTKYKPVYIVTLSGVEIGIVNNKHEIEDAIESYVQNVTEDIAYINIEEMPEFKLKFVSREEQTSEEEVLIAVRDTAIITYRRYAITLEGVQKSVVYSLDEAKSVVEEIKEEFDGDLDLDIGVVEIFDTNHVDVENVETAVAKVNDDSLIQEKLKEKEATVNGIVLHLPLNEEAKTTITSRFGSRNGGYHSGLDIATTIGTPIYAAAAGTVTYAGWQGGYGNLVIISHGNGVETYYAHCTSIYVSTGETVETGELISSVGSTGNSTGPHLHLEVRVNGVAQNPQNYLYK